jgi:hypothetical protein
LGLLSTLRVSFILSGFFLKKGRRVGGRNKYWRTLVAQAGLKLLILLKRWDYRTALEDTF